MKTLDRYVIASFVKNYLISFFVLVGMYVVLDMMFNFDELVEVQDKAGLKGVDSALAILRSAADYYLYQLPVFFVHLSGMIPVVAAAFTLIRFSRFNELCAMLAAGVPLLRIASPIIIVSLVLNGLLLLDQELLIPGIIPKLVRSRQDAGQVTATGHFQVPAIEDENRAVLNVARYKPGPGEPSMTELTLIERDEQYRPVSKIVARSAQWDPQARGWRLEGGQRVTGLLPTEPRKVAPVELYRSNITPEEINLNRSGNYVEYLSTRRIDELLARPQSFGVVPLLRVKHSRFAQPLINIILLLLAIPCVMTRQPTELKAAALKCLLLTGLCLATTFLTLQLSGQPFRPEWAAQWPAIMAWMPIMIFGPIAVLLLDRVPT